MRRLLAAVLILLTAGSAAGATVWVDDDLRITLRRGQGTSFQILRMLNSGTPLELLEEGPEWSRVRTSGGTEGWVLNQYLSREPIAADQLAAAQERVSALQQTRRELNERVTTLEADKGALTQQVQQLQQSREQLQQQLADLERLAAAPRRLANENQQLQSQVGTLQQTVQQLSSENESLRNNEQREWFITGASVAGAGILLGLLLPLLGRRRKRSGWSEL